MGRMSNHPTRDAVAALLQDGLSKSEIGRRLGVSPRTVGRWVDKISVDKEVALKSADSTEVLEFLEQLAPIQVNGRQTPVSKNVDTGFAVVIGDTHFGHHCEATIGLFLRVLQDLNPATVILNGDTLDLLAVSKYPKDVRYNMDLAEERIAYHRFLADIRSILGSDAKIIETNANHSGNGVEGRWWRYLSERLGAVAALPDVLESLKYDRVFIPDWANVQLEEVVELCNGNLHIMHGDVVRKHGGQSARGMMDKWFTSIIMNHTHRMGMTAQRIPGIGSKPEQSFIAYENGCACNLNPTYATAANWQNGFSIVALGQETFGVEQVQIVNKRATILALGSTYAAK